LERVNLEEVDVMATVGVESSLSDIRNALEGKGYQVIILKNEEDAKGCDCCVISGGDMNVMGVEDVVTQGSVITTQGMTTEQVLQAVESQIH
jgi:glutamine amidotransferase PdxT